MTVQIYEIISAKQDFHAFYSCLIKHTETTIITITSLAKENICLFVCLCKEYLNIIHIRFTPSIQLVSLPIYSIHVYGLVMLLLNTSYM